MATALGRFLKKLRLDNDELLFDMAKKIEMPPSTLSAMETGRRRPSKGLAEKIVSAYRLTEEQIQQLHSSISEANGFCPQILRLGWRRQGGNMEDTEQGEGLTCQATLGA